MAALLMSRGELRLGMFLLPIYIHTFEFESMYQSRVGRMYRPSLPRQKEGIKFVKLNYRCVGMYPAKKLKDTLLPSPRRRESEMQARRESEARPSLERKGEWSGGVRNGAERGRGREGIREFLRPIFIALMCDCTTPRNVFILR